MYSSTVALVILSLVSVSAFVCPGRPPVTVRHRNKAPRYLTLSGKSSGKEAEGEGKGEENAEEERPRLLFAAYSPSSIIPGLGPAPSDAEYGSEKDGVFVSNSNGADYAKQVVVNMRVPPQNRAIWESMALKLSEAARSIEGCTSYTFSKVTIGEGEGDAEGADYQLVARWSNADAERLHWESDEFLALTPLMTSLCETTSVVTSVPLTEKKPKSRVGEKKEDGSVVLGQIELKGKLSLAFTCKKCETRSMYEINRVAYYEGVVICTCKGCAAKHLIADNKGLMDFPDFGKGNIEQYMKAHGESVQRLVLNLDGVSSQFNAANAEGTD